MCLLLAHSSNAAQLTKTVAILLEKREYRQKLEQIFIEEVAHDRFDTAQKILNQGISINFHRNYGHFNDGATPLFVFAMGGLSRQVPWLLDHGADIFIENEGKNIYYYANIDLHSQALSFFITYMSTKPKTLFQSVLATNANIQIKDLANLIFAYAYDPSKTILNRGLLKAAEYCHYDLVRFFLAQGADSNTRHIDLDDYDNKYDNKKGLTPLMCTIKWGQYYCTGDALQETISSIKELLQHNASLTIQDTEGKSAEDYANNVYDQTTRAEILALFEEHKKKLVAQEK
jgi:hypothetical protein